MATAGLFFNQFMRATLDRIENPTPTVPETHANVGHPAWLATNGYATVEREN